MEWILNNLGQVLIFAGLGLLAIEVTVLGFSTFFLFFLGLASLISGILMYMGVVPETAVNALISLAVLTLASALLLWRPLKTMQEQVERKPVQSDLIGYSFALESDIDPAAPGSHRFSGVTWKVKSTEPLNAGTEVEVVRADVGELTVAPKPATTE